ncbi:LOW QUALITY PROTEIN: F-box only protein 36b [Chaetodon trifascialis]|uniref:LOW QUALITY PROTEIN: F-box only protein 36b n=1 Tax=Chaetodon trifascialis TaxID=109706 RepID=UPI0039953093
MGFFQGEVSMVFGRQFLQNTKDLCKGHLERLSDSLCGSEEFWEWAVRCCCNTLSAEVVSLVPEVGWCNIFFTSKLQLQKLVSRRRLQLEEQQKEYVSNPNTKAQESPDESSHSDQTSGSEESHPGIIPNLSLGTVTGTAFDTTSDCVDPGRNPEPEAGSDSSMPVSGQSVEDNFVVETAAQQNSALSNSKGEDTESILVLLHLALISMEE